MGLSLRARLEAAIRKLPPELRNTAEDNLRLLKGKAGLTPRGLARLLSDPGADPRAQAVAIWLVGLARERSLAPLLEQIVRSGPREEILWESAKSLCALGQGGSLFRELTHSTDPETRRVAAYALGCLRDSSAAEDLHRLLDSTHEPPTVRGQAAEALGSLRLANSLPYLLRAVRDPSPEVRFWAAFALGEIGDPEAEQPLQRMAESDHAVVEGWWEVSKEASDALEKIRSPGESPPDAG